MNSAIVIIPSTGIAELEHGIQSILEQTVPTDVLVVFDGPSFGRPLRLPDDPSVRTLVLPFNTGANRTAQLPPEQRGHWFGAGVMCAASYLVNNDYVMFLDQDNWLRDDHVASCIDAIESRPDAPFQMSFALRDVYRKDGSFVCRDDSQNLDLHPGALGQFIDTSCYFFRTDFLMKTAHFWLSGWGGDRLFLRKILENYGGSCLAGTGRYTVHYRLGGNTDSVTEAIFLEGNEMMRASRKPWSIE
ncbi:putative glycosyltransferase [Candidatus Burkholderia humilis]|nr:putative glycosyltransferase [Candidatus Burkholderia humilis]